MTNSKQAPKNAYVWIWLPGETSPVVAGVLTLDGKSLVFNYGKSYLERQNKIAIYNPELPLQRGLILPFSGLSMPGCIRDGSPDNWGRRVIMNSLIGKKGSESAELSELTYLLESGSDRIGALDFQLSPTNYEPRGNTSTVTLEELMKAAEKVEKGIPLTRELDLALNHGSPIGGARPKALIEEDRKKYIAKFSSSSDTYSVIKAEFIAMRLARLAGLDVAAVKIVKSMHKDVLLIERFDRVAKGQEFLRRSIVSSLTLFELDEMFGHYASYEKLCEIIRHRFVEPKKTLKELFGRIVFNVLCGNTDDHARNHAAFWDGSRLTLTPAYDICPQVRTGNIANQAMFIIGDKKESQLQTCLLSSSNFLLSEKEALKIVQHQMANIVKYWGQVCEEAEISLVDQKLLSRRQFFNPYVFENLDAEFAREILPMADFFHRN